jgi:hypothetical protein
MLKINFNLLIKFIIIYNSLLLFSSYTISSNKDYELNECIINTLKLLGYPIEQIKKEIEENNQEQISKFNNGFIQYLWSYIIIMNPDKYKNLKGILTDKKICNFFCSYNTFYLNEKNRMIQKKNSNQNYSQEQAEKDIFNSFINNNPIFKDITYNLFLDLSDALKDIENRLPEVVRSYVKNNKTYHTDKSNNIQNSYIYFKINDLDDKLSINNEKEYDIVKFTEFNNKRAEKSKITSYDYLRINAKNKNKNKILFIFDTELITEEDLEDLHNEYNNIKEYIKNNNLENIFLIGFKDIDKKNLIITNQHKIEELDLQENYKRIIQLPINNKNFNLKKHLPENSKDYIFVIKTAEEDKNHRKEILQNILSNYSKEIYLGQKIYFTKVENNNNLKEITFLPESNCTYPEFDFRLINYNNLNNINLFNSTDQDDILKKFENLCIERINTKINMKDDNQVKDFINNISNSLIDLINENKTNEESLVFSNNKFKNVLTHLIHIIVEKITDSKTTSLTPKILYNLFESELSKFRFNYLLKIERKKLFYLYPSNITSRLTESYNNQQLSINFLKIKELEINRKNIIINKTKKELEKYNIKDIDNIIEFEYNFIPVNQLRIIDKVTKLLTQMCKNNINNIANIGLENYKLIIHDYTSQPSENIDAQRIHIENKLPFIIISKNIKNKISLSNKEVENYLKDYLKTDEKNQIIEREFNSEYKKNIEQSNILFYNLINKNTHFFKPQDYKNNFIRMIMVIRLNQDKLSCHVDRECLFSKQKSELDIKALVEKVQDRNYGKDETDIAARNSFQYITNQDIFESEEEKVPLLIKYQFHIDYLEPTKKFLTSEKSKILEENPNISNEELIEKLEQATAINKSLLKLISLWGKGGIGKSSGIYYQIKKYKELYLEFGLNPDYIMAFKKVGPGNTFKNSNTLFIEKSDTFSMDLINETDNKAVIIEFIDEIEGVLPLENESKNQNSSNGQNNDNKYAEDTEAALKKKHQELYKLCGCSNKDMNLLSPALKTRFGKIIEINYIDMFIIKKSLDDALKKSGFNNIKLSNSDILLYFMTNTEQRSLNDNSDKLIANLEEIITINKIKKNNTAEVSETLSQLILTYKQTSTWNYYKQLVKKITIKDPEEKKDLDKDAIALAKLITDKSIDSLNFWHSPLAIIKEFCGKHMATAIPVLIGVACVIGGKYLWPWFNPGTAEKPSIMPNWLQGTLLVSGASIGLTLNTAINSYYIHTSDNSYNLFWKIFDHVKFCKINYILPFPKDILNSNRNQNIKPFIVKQINYSPEQNYSIQFINSNFNSYNKNNENNINNILKASSKNFFGIFNPDFNFEIEETALDIYKRNYLNIEQTKLKCLSYIKNLENLNNFIEQNLESNNDNDNNKIIICDKNTFLNIIISYTCNNNQVNTYLLEKINNALEDKKSINNTTNKNNLIDLYKLLQKEKKELENNKEHYAKIKKVMALDQANKNFLDAIDEMIKEEISNIYTYPISTGWYLPMPENEYKKTILEKIKNQNSKLKINKDIEKKYKDEKIKRYQDLDDNNLKEDNKDAKNKEKTFIDILRHETPDPRSVFYAFNQRNNNNNKSDNKE